MNKLKLQLTGRHMPQSTSSGIAHMLSHYCMVNKGHVDLINLMVAGLVYEAALRMQRRLIAPANPHKMTFSVSKAEAAAIIYMHTQTPADLLNVFEQNCMIEVISQLDKQIK